MITATMTGRAEQLLRGLVPRTKEIVERKARESAQKAETMMRGLVVVKGSANRQDALGGAKAPRRMLADPVRSSDGSEAVRVEVGPYYGDPRTDGRLVDTVTELGADRGLIRTALKVRIRKLTARGNLGRGRIRRVLFSDAPRLQSWAEAHDQVRRRMFFLTGPHFIVPLIVKPALDQVLPAARAELAAELQSEVTRGNA